MGDAPAEPLAWRDAAIQSFRYHKSLAERAVAQVTDEALHRPLDPHTNSIAVIMKHVGGNLRSRWTDFLTTDGEKPWRNRDDEFVDSFATRDELMAAWDAGWTALLDSLQSLSAQDYERTVVVRGEPHSIPLAIARALAHACYHVGQIVQLARHWAGDEWETLTIARGGSAAHNQTVWGAGDYRRRSQ
ncbi:MAG TPA: DinB family protein [Lacipirellulaceae bacterium]|nr:DinB family protein [Lacipirellulaceae bacterium]